MSCFALHKPLEISLTSFINWCRKEDKRSMRINVGNKIQAEKKPKGENIQTRLFFLLYTKVYTYVCIVTT